VKKHQFFRLSVLFVTLVLTFVNLLIAQSPCTETGPSFNCDRRANRKCQRECMDQGGCHNYYWEKNYCSFGICYEQWTYECNSGYSGGWSCYSTWGYCGVK